MVDSLRDIYDVMSSFPTATQTVRCSDHLRQLMAKDGDNLAKCFADALEENRFFDQIKCPFIPDKRSHKSGRNPVTSVMAKSSPIKVKLTGATPYEFTYLQREIPHLRTTTLGEQTGKAWIDYVGRRFDRPILGEIKWKSDQNPFYAFIQLLTYLSEMATPNQVARSIKHELFGREITAISAFDLHIFLGNFNDRGEKGKLIELTRQLASEFKTRLQRDHPTAATLLGNVLCISGQINKGCDCFAHVKCLWMV